MNYGGTTHVVVRPLPPRVVPTYVGKGDSQVRTQPQANRPLPPWIAGEKDSFGSTKQLRNQTRGACRISFTCQTSWQGSCTQLRSILTTESRSPATRGGRGRREPCRAPCITSARMASRRDAG